MNSIRRFAAFGFLIVSVGLCAAAPAGADHPARIQRSESDTSSAIIQRVAPVYPTSARVRHIEGTVVLGVVIAQDGSLLHAETVSGDPTLVRAALEAVMKWRYRPTLVEGKPVEVATTITLDFKLDGPPSSPSAHPSASAPASVLDSEAASPAIIRLKNGRVIRAETARRAGDKLEYTIGDSTYEIPHALVEEITHSTDALPATSSPDPDPASNTVVARSLRKAPIAFGEDSQNWYLFESTRQLREECQNGQFPARLHPEFQSRSNFPVSETEAKNTCAMIAEDMGSEYETLVDRGVELQKILCTSGGGRLGPAPSPDPTIAGYQSEMQHIFADYGKLSDGVLNEPGQPRRGMRIMIDFYRLAGTCGHGL